MRQHNHIRAVVEEMDSPQVVGNRLYKIRYVAGYRARKQAKFAQAVGVEPKSYSQWEIGDPIAIPIQAAIMVCEWTGNGVDLDYIYRGRLEGLGPGWVLPLKEAPDRYTFAQGRSPPVRRKGDRARP